MTKLGKDSWQPGSLTARPQGRWGRAARKTERAGRAIFDAFTADFLQACSDLFGKWCLNANVEAATDEREP